MNKAKAGVVALVLLFLAGLWLVAAPFVVGYQPRGAGFSDATVNDLWVGGLLAGLSFATLVGYTGAALRAVARRGGHTGDHTA
ncbi:MULTISPECIES: hypothetical protein [unclassified Nonomuraea]|uniref:hypothetical protein n=1 Tax=unclassified Nonomuraea TaxID=2593643 RepID=UPI0033F975E5